MYNVRKQFSFSAAHHLEGLPLDHPCSSQHGHNYLVEIVLSNIQLNNVCFVRDYRELEAFKTYIDKNFDHKDLNEIGLCMQTSAENLAFFFYNWCKRLWPETSMVRISETPKTWAEYSA